MITINYTFSVFIIYILYEWHVNLSVLGCHWRQSPCSSMLMIVVDSFACIKWIFSLYIFLCFDSAASIVNGYMLLNMVTYVYFEETKYRNGLVINRNNSNGVKVSHCLCSIMVQGAPEVWDLQWMTFMRKSMLNIAHFSLYTFMIIKLLSSVISSLILKTVRYNRQCLLNCLLCQGCSLSVHLETLSGS